VRVGRIVTRALLTTGVITTLGAPLRAPLRAQERLVGQQTIGGGVSFEGIRFGGDGLRQFGFASLDSARVRSVRQLSMPVTTAWALGPSWRVDLTALYASATVTYRDAKQGSADRTATLSGVSDVRVRATGTLINELLVMTAGVNLPSGQTSLSGNEFAVLRIMAAPALGLGSTPVGAGASGTLGLVAARRVGPWAVAVGGSYEYRGKYQPVAALVAGSASADFRPGGVMRASLTGDRTVGPHRLSLAFTADVFAEDELRSPVSGGTTTSASTLVRLGPVVSGDVQMQFAANGFRQLLGYASLRMRAPYSRNGETVKKSSGQYADAGMRAAIGLGPQRDLVLAADGRLHTGLGVDEGLPTSGVASGSVSVGLEVRRGLFSVQPYVRGQAGSLRQRNTGPTVPSQSFTGYASGVVAVIRF